MTIRPKRATGLAVAATVIAAPLTLLPLAALAGAAAHHPQQRTVAVTSLSQFRVVLTATRTSKLDATVTAWGYRPGRSGWRLVGTSRIGKAGSWSWYATEVCSLTVSQYRPIPSSAKPSDSITVRLLWGPAVGCLGPYTRHWHS
jgi:hypothetical protein